MKTYFLVFIAVILNLTACSKDLVSEYPNKHQDFIYSDDLKIPIHIAKQKLGFLANVDVNEKQILSFLKSNNLEVIKQYPGGIYIAQLTEVQTRDQIYLLAKQTSMDSHGLIAKAGLVVTTDVDKDVAPMVVTDELIIQFKAGTAESEIKKFFDDNSDLKIVTQNIYDLNQFLVVVKTTSSDRDVLSYANKFYENILIEFSHPNYVVVVDYRETIPNDTLFNNQWPHRNTGQAGGTIDADVDTSMAWDISQGVNATVIAVIDSGFDTGHLDLTPNLWTNPLEIAGDGIDNDGNGRIDDINGWDFRGNDNTLAGGNHGTSVAGVVAARGGNNRGVTGSCPNCSLMLIRNGATVFAQGQAFGYAQQMGANIITNSWGYSIGTAATANVVTAINNAAVAGSIIFFAMNNGNVNDCIGATPDISSIANVIAVSAVSNQDRKVTESAFGNCMDLVAPTHRGYGPNPNGRPAGSGVPFTGTLNVPSTDLRNNPGYNNTSPQNAANGFDPNYCPAETANRNYTFCFGGTSSATPLAAGIAGLVLSARPALSRLQVQRLLQDTADKVEDSVAGYAESTGFSSTGGVASHGYGRVNAFEAVRVVAPVAQGGNNGIDVLIRDNRLDWGNTEQRSNVLMEPTRGFIPHYQSVDIKVDSPPYETAPTTSAQFDAFTHQNPVSNAVNKVYVRVHNRGPVSANQVTVKLHWAFAGTALPSLPGDFWTRFPNDSLDLSSRWTSLGRSTVNNLAYSGSSVAGTAGDNSQILSYDFTGPALDSTVAAFRHYCLFAVLDSNQDRVLAASRASLVPDFITPRDNNVTHRNVTVEDPTRSDRFAASFFARNPFTEIITTRLRIKAPKDWVINLEPSTLKEAFTLKANEEVLVNLKYQVNDKQTSGEVEIFQEYLVGNQFEVLGGMTYRVEVPRISPDKEDCITYNPEKLYVIDEGKSGWLLTDGISRMLKLSNAQDADATLKLAKQHHYQCFIGRNNNRTDRKDYIVQYWK
jgi:hypothetical protein